MKNEITGNAIAYPYIVADIGGTNARFGLINGKTPDGKSYKISDRLSYRCAEFGSLEELLRTYVDSLNGADVYGACLAIAGPVSGDLIRLTNLDWSFSLNELKKRFNISNFIVINDFTALAYATTRLRAEDLVNLNDHAATELASRAVVGPGTGLGVSTVVPVDGKWCVVAGEGGHAAFSPSDDLEIQILKVLKRDIEHVSIETILSGSGLVRLYKALCEIRDEQAEDLKPWNITGLGLTGKNKICREVLDVFCAILGSVAGDIALTTGSRGGVYIGGGIISHIKSFLLQSAFMERFNAKGVMSPYVRSIPVFLMDVDNPALVGAAAWLEDKTRTDKKEAIWAG
jgi:glucokinase